MWRPSDGWSFALSVAIAIVATAWQGRHGPHQCRATYTRQLALTAGQFAAALDQALSAQLQAVQAAALLQAKRGVNNP